MSEVDPLTGADDGFDLLAGFEGEQGGIADEQGCIRALEHRNGIGRCREKLRPGMEEVAEENLSVGA